MEAQIERRSYGLPRVPVDLLVELSNDGDEEVFEADAIDLGPGGIGLRAAVLPEVGQRLRCRFEVPGAEETCEARGEVVWAADAGRWMGSFGVRFDGLDERAAAALEAIAPAPVEDPGTPEELRAPRTVKVRLDGVASAIEGEITSQGETISIEQAMPFLQIGRGAELEHGDAKVRAVLERVRLRVENGTPRLVLELAPAPEAEAAAPEAQAAVPQEAGEDALEASADATIQDEALESLLARAGATPEAAVEDPSPTLDGIADASEDESDEAMEQRAIARAERARDAERKAAVERAPSARREREAAKVVARDEVVAADAEASDAEREEAPIVVKARELAQRAKPAAAEAWASTKSLAVVVIRRSGPWVARARDGIVAAWRTLAARIAQRVPKLAPMLGQPARRRTTAVPPAAVAAQPARRARGAAPARAATPGRGRTIAIGVIAALAVGLAVYGLASRPETPSDAVEIHRPIETAARPAEVEPTIAAPVTVPETIEPIAAPEPLAGSALPAAAAPSWDRAMPEPESAAGPIPAPSYPTMADRVGSAPSAIEPAAARPSAGPRSMEFGAPSIERGRTTTLRLSAPVQYLEGQADAGGFTVTVHGALSLDRAAPLAAANSAIERASIINRGDHCVLTIRFVTGRTPPYRVVAEGSTLSVTFGR